VTNYVTDISTGANPPDILNAVIEIPMRSRNKYEYNEQENYFFLSRVLPSPFGYPLDYGFIPQTRSDDGDALDVLVMLYESTFPGCVMEVRPIGLARMLDEKGVDDKIIAVATADPRLNEINEMSDLGEFWQRGIDHFFREYKRLGSPLQWSEVVEWEDREAARKVVLSSMERYQVELNEGQESLKVMLARQEGLIHHLERAKSAEGTKQLIENLKKINKELCDRFEKCDVPDDKEE